MAQVTNQKDAERTSPDDDGDTTVTHVGDGPEKVAGPSGKDLAESRGQRAPSKRDDKPGMFTIYKKGQGYWTRMGTALGAGLIIALTTWFFYKQLPPWLTPAFTPENATVEQNRAAFSMARNTTIAICIVMLGGLSLLAWRLMNRPGNVDFLIATDGEMKKVNWTSRRELIGSTKVVIIFMFLIAFILFAIDIIFGYFFHLIRVLDAGPFG
jgi:preprotein translocase SecE subunit